MSKDWKYAIDEKGERHILFGVANLSFYDMTYISDLLSNTRWSWFNSVRDTPEYKAALEWVNNNK